MKVYPLIVLTALAVNLFVWSFVYGQRRTDKVNRAFLLATGWSTLWILAELVLCLDLSRGYEAVIHRFLTAVWLFVGFFFLHFVYRLIDRTLDKGYYGFLAASFFVSVIGVSTDWVNGGVTRYDWGVVDLPGPLFQWFFVVPGGSSLWGMVLLGREILAGRESADRNTYSYIFIGAALTLTVASTTNLVMPVFLGITSWYRLAGVSMAIFGYSIYRAVIRYNFLLVTVDQVAEELFDDARDGIILTTSAGEVKRINRAAARMLEVDVHAVQKRGVRELLGQDDSSRRPLPMEISMGAGDERRHYSLSRSGINSKGVPIGEIIIVRDVTQETKAREVLENAKEELEEEVEKRTRELRHAQKMEAIGTLAGGIAHDFNNLLSAILGFAEAARDDVEPNSRVREDIDEVLFAAKRAREIVQQILTFSRRDEQQHRTLDFGTVVSEAIALMRVSLPSTVNLGTQLHSRPLPIKGDAGLLNQVILNLCTNSYHAIGDQIGTIRVTLEEDYVDEAFAKVHPPISKGPCARLDIEDSGCGIAEEHLDRIFDPFFTTKEVGKGTGLGLSTVLGIVESHRGTVTVKSQPGKGTVFSIFIPLDQEAGVQEETKLSSLSALDGGSGRVLLVDDEEQLVRVGWRMLEPLGYEVTAYTDSLDALEAFRTAPDEFDIVITDHTMPNMTGVALAKKIIDLRPDTPVILMTGYSDSSIPEHAAKVGVKVFLRKPVTRKVLSETVQRLIAESGGPRR